MIPIRPSFIHRKVLAGIRHESGYCYVGRVGIGGPSSHRHPSTALLLEDNVPLPGPANALHDEIRQVGEGRYSFWKGMVYFSTPDHSDPRTNGRRYTFDRIPLQKRIKGGIVAAFRRYGFLFWEAFYWICFFRVLWFGPRFHSSSRKIMDFHKRKNSSPDLP